MQTSNQPLAHLDGERPHYLLDHLEAVGELAAAHAGVFGAEEWGRQAGRCHDLGKVPEEFQRRLYGDPRRHEHSIHGALFWMQSARQQAASALLAAMVAGHHAGLPDLKADSPVGRPRTSLRNRLAQQVDLETVLATLPVGFLADRLPELPARLVDSKLDKHTLARRWEVFTRFVFSALVDADILDTVEFYHGDERRQLLTGFAKPAQLAKRLDEHIDGLVRRANLDGISPVNRLRAEVLKACRERATAVPGLFSLTVPTGGGKTLSAMSFALRHAAHHGLRRVITAIPYTSILEQTVEVYAEALGRDQIVEHHSAFEPEKLGHSHEQMRRHELAAENWDAPIVVTTNVQLFESLFANRTSQCRKLHNIARSVILLDEAQTVPTELLAPILDLLRELVEGYGCTVVLATATQPAFSQRPGFEFGLEGIREIAPRPRHLARQLARYEVEWRLDDTVDWNELAGELAGHPRLLTIVHNRADAQLLAAALLDETDDTESVIHLSAAMCGDHRRTVLEQVRRRLDEGLPCRLISTQLIEAGVDVDFPVVYRAFGGLESLIQAAGRCNREGRLPGLGRFVVFRAPSKPPPGAPRIGLGALESMLATTGGTLDTHNPEVVEQYFRRVYFASETEKEALQARRADLEFATVAHYFKLIDDSWSRPLVVPWGDSGEVLAEINHYGPSRERLRRLQRYTVNAPRFQIEKWQAAGLVALVGDTVLAVTALAPAEIYSPRWGLSGSTELGPEVGALML